MNISGIPAKINRHVFKALTQYMCTQNGANFNEIFDYVQACNKNLKPVANLREIIKKSLDNYQRLGIVQKDKSRTYKLPLGPRGGTKTIEKFLEQQQSMKMFKLDGPPLEPKTSPAIFSKSPKKRKLSDSSLEDRTGSLEVIQRKIRAQKSLDRRGRQTILPRAKRATIHSTCCQADLIELPEDLALQVTEMRSRRRRSHGRKRRRKHRIYDHDFLDLGEEPGRGDRDSGDELKVSPQPSLPENTGTITGQIPQEDYEEMDPEVETEAEQANRVNDTSQTRLNVQEEEDDNNNELLEPNANNVTNQQTTNEATTQLAGNNTKFFGKFNTYLN